MPRRQQYQRDTNISKLFAPERHPNPETMATHLRSLHYRTQDMQDWLKSYDVFKVMMPSTEKVTKIEPAILKEAVGEVYKKYLNKDVAAGDEEMILIVALSILQKQDPEQLVIQYGTDFGVRVNRLSRKRLDNR